MSERGRESYFPLPEPADVIQGIERELGITSKTGPEWGFQPAVERFYPEEAPTVTQRKLAESCLTHFYFFSRRPSGNTWEEPATVGDLIETYNNVREEARETWKTREIRNGPCPHPFPDFTLTHLLGACNRQIAWFEEQKAFEETADYDRVHTEYSSIRELVRQAIHTLEQHMPEEHISGEQMP